ncbi:MAG: YIP1 family protein [Caldilineaceae bacterium]|nr:YIP1 family protein [Caldilineaceae bacterium]
MLQPNTYPRLLGQALTLEPAPFVEMADDDNPWIEGLFFVFVLGLVVAIARLIGGLLLSASLPLPEAVLEAVLTGLDGIVPVASAQQAGLETGLRQIWPWATAAAHYGGGWLRLLGLIATPLGYIGQWLIYGLLCHLATRLVGGRGTLGQTLGVVALSSAPRVLLLVTILPFAAVGGLLIHVWGVLIAYRGLEVAHDLSPARAAIAALVPLVLGILVALISSTALLTLLRLTGGGA